MNKQRTILEIVGAVALFAAGVVLGTWLRGKLMTRLIPEGHCWNKKDDEPAPGTLM
jgi:uncharacterized protein YneF (UPF0154 family)